MDELHFYYRGLCTRLLVDVNGSTKRRGFIVPTFASPFRLYEKLPKAEFLSGQREVARAATTWTYFQLGRKTW